MGRPEPFRPICGTSLHSPKPSLRRRHVGPPCSLSRARLRFPSLSLTRGAPTSASPSRARARSVTARWALDVSGFFPNRKRRDPLCAIRETWIGPSCPGSSSAGPWAWPWADSPRPRPIGGPHVTASHATSARSSP
jgi:hypothetical protein